MSGPKVDVLSTLQLAADALKYAGAKREGIDQILLARQAVAELFRVGRKAEKALWGSSYSGDRVAGDELSTALNDAGATP